MSKVITNIKIFTGNEIIENGFIRFDKKFIDVSSMSFYEEKKDDVITDVEGKIIVPGFIDVHSHGGYDVDTMDANSEKIVEMAYKMAKNEGITSLFPTTMTQSFDNTDLAIKAIIEAKKSSDFIQGIHLEGPFVNPDYKGAQNGKYVVPANADKLSEWQNTADKNIKLMTYAPDMLKDNSFEFALINEKIIGSAGHTGATYNSLVKNHPVKHITHLYNAQRQMSSREPGVTGYGILTNDVNVEMIVDGHHIAPEMVKLTFDIKDHNEIELITDSMRAKGMPNGTYDLGGQEVFVKDGEARLKDGTLAGSVLTFIEAFRNVQKFTGISLSDAVKVASTNQAKEFNLFTKGNIKPDFDADFNVLSDEDNQKLEKVYSYGQEVN